jgi:hypothetical protein
MIGMLCFLTVHRFADVYFVVGQGKEMKKIPGHRVVLASSSDVFEVLLLPSPSPSLVFLFFPSSIHSSFSHATLLSLAHVISYCLA